MTNQDLESCKRDIEIIKSTIEKSKVNLGSIAKLFIYFGAFSCLLAIYFELIRNGSAFPWYQTARYVYFALEIFSSLLLIFLFAAYYAKMRRTNHLHTLLLFRVWGIVMFIIPICNVILLILTLFLFPGSERVTMQFLFSIVECVAFILALAFTGLYLNKRIMVTISLCAFLGLLLSFFFSVSFPLNASPENAYSVLEFLNRKAESCLEATRFGYICMGIYLIPKRKVKNDTE